jgi:hypothetical protein
MNLIMAHLKGCFCFIQSKSDLLLPFRSVEQCCHGLCTWPIVTHTV